MTVKDAPVVPWVHPGSGTCAQTEKVLAWRIASEATSVSYGHVVPLCIFLCHHPPKREPVEFIAEEFGHSGIFQCCGGIDDVVLQIVI